MLDAFKGTLLELLGSKKFLLLVAGLIAWAAARLGFNVDQAQIDRGLELLGALILAQSVSDHADAKKDATALTAAQALAEGPTKQLAMRKLARVANSNVAETIPKAA